MAKVKGNSKYFLAKYGTSNPVIETMEGLDYHNSFTPPSFLFLGRALAEEVPTDKDTLYVHIQSTGEFIHRSELEK